MSSLGQPRTCCIFHSLAYPCVGGNDSIGCQGEKGELTIQLFFMTQCRQDSSIIINPVDEGVGVNFWGRHVIECRRRGLVVSQETSSWPTYVDIIYLHHCAMPSTGAEQASDKERRQEAWC